MRLVHSLNNSVVLNLPYKPLKMLEFLGFSNKNMVIFDGKDWLDTVRLSKCL